MEHQLRGAGTYSHTRMLRRFVQQAALRSTLLLEDCSELSRRSSCEVTVPVASSDGRPVLRMLSLFLVRGDGDAIYAYENHCPHAGGPLNLLPNKFLSRDGQHLLCSTHGAKFNIHDGVCIRGPCKGECLNALDVAVDAATRRVTTSEASLIELCASGGGAFVEVPLNADAGDGSPVTRK